MPETRVHVEIAFVGGQTLGALVTVEAADGLGRALADGHENVYELVADDATYLVPLRAVSYVKRFSRETQIGFGRSA